MLKADSIMSSTFSPKAIIRMSQARVCVGCGYSNSRGLLGTEPTGMSRLPIERSIKTSEGHLGPQYWILHTASSMGNQHFLDKRLVLWLDKEDTSTEYKSKGPGAAPRDRSPMSTAAVGEFL